jgi:hypothetical protein
VTTLNTGNHVLRDYEEGSIVDAVPDGGNVWIDVNCIRKGVDYYVRYPSTAPNGIVVLDADPLSKFTDTNTRGITIQKGQTIRFRRSPDGSQFDIISPSGATGRASSFNVAPRRILIVGQSLGQEWEHSPAASSFLDRLAVLGDTTPTSFLHLCTGGSAALKEYRPDSTRFWFDVDANYRGQLTADVCYAIGALPSGEKPTHIFWIQGEQDSGTYAGTTTSEDDDFRSRYKQAIISTLKLIRGYINPADRYSIPVFVQILGSRTSGERVGMPIVREAQYEAIATDGINFNLGAVCPLGLPKRDDVHPTDAGYATLGELWADAFYASGL